MSEQNHNGKLSSEPSQLEITSAAITNSQQPEQGKVAAEQKLSAEEQMALYEKALKEDDWGHQPC